MLDRGLDLWNVPLFQVLGLSTPLAPEQRADGHVRKAFPDPCSCITRSRIGLDPMAPVAWKSLLFLNGRYVSLIVCCSADDDAVGARRLFRGPRGVSHITRVGVDKAGFNRLLVPYQHPLLSPNHLSHPLTSSCLESITPTSSLSSLSAMVLGSLPLGGLASTFSDSPRRGALG